MNPQNLIAKVWDYANILRDSGVSYTDYVAQLSYLLFLKMESEIANVNPSAASMIPSEFRWEVLKRLDGLELESAYSKALAELSKQGGIVGTIYQKAQNKITEPAKLKRLISLVDGETWLGLSVDVKGAIYEGLLAKNATETKAGAGQYFTPRVLCESIVRLMRPTPQMSVCDPACGTGGFLLAAYAYMKAQSNDSEVLRALREDKLYGKDITPLVVSLCAMNLFLHGLGVGFGSSAKDSSAKDSESKSSTKTPEDSRNPKQKPQRALVSEGDSLLELGNVRFDMVLTNINLSLVSNPLSAEHLADFEKCFCGGEVPKDLGDLAKNAGESSADFATPLDFATMFANRVESERFRAFGVEEILARDKANLDIFWLKDESLGEVESLPTPREIATLIKEDLQSAIREFDGVI